jgi:hypothetical protein
MRFCPGCGKRQATAAPKRYGFVLLTAVLLFGAAFGIKNGLHWKRGDVKPTEHIETAREEPVTDPELTALRSDLDRSPQDLGILRALAGLLGDKLRNRPDAPPALVFEAIDVLSRILAISPEDPDALLMMGDVSFDQKAFVKAVEFYERYLKLMPTDVGASARYASTLTFLGRYDDSIKQLDGILQRDPKNFPAMAYLAITYAQKGELLRAKELGAQALQIAPSEEARARFSGFVDSLSKEQAERPSGDAASNARGPQPAQVVEAEKGAGIGAFIAQLKANPIAGPKFVSYDDTAAGVVKLIFREFPMGQMPPFAKEKFFTTLKNSAATSGIAEGSTLVFIDASSGEEMARLGL